MKFACARDYPANSTLSTTPLRAKSMPSFLVGRGRDERIFKRYEVFSRVIGISTDLDLRSRIIKIINNIQNLQFHILEVFWPARVLCGLPHEAFDG
jgi:hypothetical protein